MAKKQFLKGISKPAKCVDATEFLDNEMIYEQQNLKRIRRSCINGGRKSI